MASSMIPANPATAEVALFLSDRFFMWISVNAEKVDWGRWFSLCTFQRFIHPLPLRHSILLQICAIAIARSQTVGDLH